MDIDQRALRFHCQSSSSLIGVVDVPERPLTRGVLIVADSAQYRAGSHRQSTLLSRMLAARGIPVLRFDRRGMGDSDGETRSFETIDEDIRAAIKEFSIHIPEMKEIVLWGLGDAATAAAFYAHTDPRVTGLVLLNPWVRAAEGTARAMLRHYYLARLGEGRFWKKIAAGKLDLALSAAALRHSMRIAAGDRKTTLPRRVLASLACFDGQVLVVLSGDDPSAREFSRLVERHHLKCRRVHIPGANHSLSKREWRDEAASVGANWIVSW